MCAIGKVKSKKMATSFRVWCWRVLSVEEEWKRKGEAWSRRGRWQQRSWCYSLMIAGDARVWHRVQPRHWQCGITLRKTMCSRVNVSPLRGDVCWIFLQRSGATGSQCMVRLWCVPLQLAVMWVPLERREISVHGVTPSIRGAAVVCSSSTCSRVGTFGEAWNLNAWCDSLNAWCGCLHFPSQWCAYLHFLSLSNGASFFQMNRVLFLIAKRSNREDLSLFLHNGAVGSLQKKKSCNISFSKIFLMRPHFSYFFCVSYFSRFMLG